MCILKKLKHLYKRFIAVLFMNKLYNQGQTDMRIAIYC